MIFKLADFGIVGIHGFLPGISFFVDLYNDDSRVAITQQVLEVMYEGLVFGAVVARFVVYSQDKFESVA